MLKLESDTWSSSLRAFSHERKYQEDTRILRVLIPTIYTLFLGVTKQCADPTDHIDRLTDHRTDSLADSLTCCLIHHVTDGLTDRLTFCITDHLTESLTNSPTDCQTYCITDRLTDLLINIPLGGLGSRLADGLFGRLSDRLGGLLYSRCGRVDRTSW